MIHGEETRADKREHLKVALDVYKDRAEDHQNPIKWGLWYGISIVFLRHDGLSPAVSRFFY